MQNRAMREYAARRGWTIAFQVCEANSGAVRREAREKLLQAARRQEIDVVLVWRLDRWGRSVTDLLSTFQELERLDVGFVSLTEALDLTTPAMLCVRHRSDHSPRTLSIPRNRNCRNPRACFIWPNTGSTIALRAA